MQGAVTFIAGAPLHEKTSLLSLGQRPLERRLLPTSRVHLAIAAAIREHVLAIDVGTSGTKAAVISSDGTVKVSSFSPHPLPTSSAQLQQGSAEQDPGSWWLATKHAVCSCLSKMSSMTNESDCPLVKVVAVTGQMQDVILIPNDDDDYHQRHAILYSDTRATLEANEVSTLAGGDEHLVHVTGMKQGATRILASQTLNAFHS
ncbi:hypothetical protein KP509_32G006100 [Ceratopteris richardii]|uniref:Carbohydrate kinase FGGY N-terminal domain-containing protein n=1 Tax=Ceratopteris richardii TaxID=49495 RepID=A0A8T2QRC6_CERRI|nr:hypothetical protein KP509_32G006100 [Ceratopteris richardii]